MAVLRQMSNALFDDPRAIPQLMTLLQSSDFIITESGTTHSLWGYTTSILAYMDAEKLVEAGIASLEGLTPKKSRELLYTMISQYNPCAAVLMGKYLTQGDAALLEEAHYNLPFLEQRLESLKENEVFVRYYREYLEAPLNDLIENGIEEHADDIRTIVSTMQSLGNS